MLQSQNLESPGQPWYESNLLWGPLALILTLVASVKHDLGWLLIFAWLCFVVVIWRLARTTREVLLVTILGALVAGGVLLGLSNWLRPKTQYSIVDTASNRTAPIRQSEQIHAASSSTPLLPTPLPTQKKTKALGKEVHTAAEGTVRGKDNTVVGHVPYRSIKGDGNTIVGATDANGNTIIPGGTAIGTDATADPTSVAIGANSHAGGTVEQGEDGIVSSAFSHPVKQDQTQVVESNTALADEAIRLAGGIRKLSAYWKERKVVIEGAGLSEQDKQNRVRALDVETMENYNRLYKGRSIDLHQRLLNRLESEDEDISLTLFYERGFNPDSLELNATDLERLARRLLTINQQK